MILVADCSALIALSVCKSLGLLERNRLPPLLGLTRHSGMDAGIQSHGCEYMASIEPESSPYGIG